MSDDSRFSVCQLTMPDTSFEEDLELIVGVRVGGVALAEAKLRDGDGPAQVEALLTSGLAATVCVPANISPLPLHPAVIYPGPEDLDERVSLMCDSVRRLAPFQPDCIVMVTGSEKGRSRPDAMRMATEGLREVARVAGELDTRIALEVCRDVGFDGSFLRSLPEAIEFIDEVDSPHIGICYDTYHVWDGPDILEHTERHASRIFGVQLSDWREPPRGYADRLVPGDGPIDFPGIIGALERGGYTGWYDFELFSDDGRWGTELPDSLWKLPYGELLQRGLAGFHEAWNARTLAV
jgi:sugar phosphate isomerase/epimerase